MFNVDFITFISCHYSTNICMSFIHAVSVANNRKFNRKCIICSISLYAIAKIAYPCNLMYSLCLSSWWVRSRLGQCLRAGSLKLPSLAKNSRAASQQRAVVEAFRRSHKHVQVRMYKNVLYLCGSSIQVVRCITDLGVYS